MSFRSFLLVIACVGSVWAAEVRLSDIRRIYILPMSGGLDQYLANRLVASGKFAVVTDPARADAVLTDQIGAGFEDRYQALYPPPPPPPEPKDTSKDKRANPEEEKSLVAQFGALAQGSRTSSFSRGKGNVFLVDRQTRQVVWSTFLRPKTTRPDVMNRTADRIVDRMEGTLSHESKLARSGGQDRDVMMAVPRSSPAALAAPAPALSTPAGAPAAAAPVTITPPAPARTPAPAAAAAPPASTVPAQTPAPAPAAPAPAKTPPPAPAPAAPAQTTPPAAPAPGPAPIKP